MNPRSILPAVLAAVSAPLASAATIVVQGDFGHNGSAPVDSTWNHLSVAASNATT